MYDRTDLIKAIPDATYDVVGDGTQEECQAFADAFNKVLDVLRSEFLAGQEELSEREITEAVCLANDAWNEFCGQDGDIDRTIEWVRTRI